MSRNVTKSLCGYWLLLSTFALAACTTHTTASKLPEPVPVLQKIATLPSGNQPVQLFFIDKHKGWLVTDKNIWSTNNEGKTWELIYQGEANWDPVAFIDNLQFINSKIGWMLVSPEGIYKTEDGGRTWKQQPDAFPNGATHSFRFFKDGKQGWAAGVVLAPPPKEYADKTLRGDSYAAISNTTDGGLSWQQQIVPNTRSILELYFKTQEYGWALGWPGLFYLDYSASEWKAVKFFNGKCSDQGLMDTLYGNNYMHEPVAIYFLDSAQGWLSFKNGYMAKTMDGGRTWCDLLNPRDVWPSRGLDTYFQKIHFADPQRGWALGSSSLYETKDGGVTWNKVNANDEFIDLYFLESEYGWAISNKGLYRING